VFLQKKNPGNYTWWFLHYKPILLFSDCGGFGTRPRELTWELFIVNITNWILLPQTFGFRWGDWRCCPIDSKTATECRLCRRYGEIIPTSCALRIYLRTTLRFAVCPSVRSFRLIVGNARQVRSVSRVLVRRYRASRAAVHKLSLGFAWCP